MVCGVNTATDGALYDRTWPQETATVWQGPILVLSRGAREILFEKIDRYDAMNHGP